MKIKTTRSNFSSFLKKIISASLITYSSSANTGPLINDAVLNTEDGKLRCKAREGGNAMLIDIFLEEVEVIEDGKLTLKDLKKILKIIDAVPAEDMMTIEYPFMSEKRAHVSTRKMTADFPTAEPIDIISSMEVEDSTGESLLSDNFSLTKEKFMLSPTSEMLGSFTMDANDLRNLDKMANAASIATCVIEIRDDKTISFSWRKPNSDVNVTNTCDIIFEGTPFNYICTYSVGLYAASKYITGERITVMVESSKDALIFLGDLEGYALLPTDDDGYGEESDE